MNKENKKIIEKVMKIIGNAGWAEDVVSVMVWNGPRVVSVATECNYTYIKIEELNDTHKVIEILRPLFKSL